MAGEHQPSLPQSPSYKAAESQVRRRWRRVWRILVPAAVLAGSLGVSLALYFGFLGSAWVEGVARWTATWASVALNLLGASTRVDGNILSSQSFAVNIVKECTAVGPLVLFTGAIIAYPAPLRAKAMGILLGLVLLTAVNVVRIVTLFWIGSAFPQYLSVAHLLVWQTAMILFAIVLWLFWVERIAVARRV